MRRRIAKGVCLEDTCGRPTSAASVLVIIGFNFLSVVASMTVVVRRRNCSPALIPLMVLKVIFVEVAARAADS